MITRKNTDAAKASARLFLKVVISVMCCQSHRKMKNPIRITIYATGMMFIYILTLSALKMTCINVTVLLVVETVVPGKKLPTCPK